jgi:hypothetical protein
VAIGPPERRSVEVTVEEGHCAFDGSAPLTLESVPLAAVPHKGTSSLLRSLVGARRALCEADGVEAVVGTDGGAFVMPELVGDPTLQETMISSIGGTHGVLTTQPSIHRRFERTRVVHAAPQCCRLR